MPAPCKLGITAYSLVLGAVAEPAIACLPEPRFGAVHLPHPLVNPIAFVIALAAAMYRNVAERSA
ncbi:hypothetical protein ACWGJB_46475 [Streptomyces sp. NPDC054813]